MNEKKGRKINQRLTVTERQMIQKAYREGVGIAELAIRYNRPWDTVYGAAIGKRGGGMGKAGYGGGQPARTDTTLVQGPPKGNNPPGLYV